MRNAQHYRGIDVTDGGRDGNLRHIRRCRFENSQHSRGFDVPARGRAGDLRHIRRCSFRNRRHSRGFDVPVNQKADTHGDSTSRPAAGAVISCIFRDAVFEIGNPHGDSTPRTAKRLALSRNRSRACRFCRVLSVRWGTRSSGSRAARRFCPARPQNHGTFETQVARFACGTPILPHRTVKTRHHGGPEAPEEGAPASHGSTNQEKTPPK